jgi:hypothetical protein
MPSVSPNPITYESDKLPVIDAANHGILLFVTESEASRLVFEGKAIWLRTNKKKIRGVKMQANAILGDSLKPVKPTSIRQRGTMGDSHDHERDDNPEHVWTIDRIARNKRKHFLQVVTDCLIAETDSLKPAA